MSSRCRSLAAPLAAALAIAAVAGACGGQAGQPDAPRGGIVPEDVRLVPLRPGAPVAAHPQSTNPFAGDPQAAAEGRRLYTWMNCVGCHFDGGGGMGPPLMDDEWIYGSEPAQIFDSIVNGRPAGMPAFGDKLVAEEIWRIVAYVQTLDPDGGAGGEQRRSAGSE
jgi:cytochrome c oxidase cbb3-type subunit 3